MENKTIDQEVKLKPKDFASDQDVRWCPGCGDYSILSQAQKVMPEIGVPKEKIVWVSGIGCSSRFPYYMSTYGFHGIHGRAPAIATGLKLSNPELSVWVATGDGDLMSIGGNHFIHTCRKNIDLNILMFNNEIYGLTKGQYSPTSERGKVTKTTPYGSIDTPFNPISLALGSKATFIARSIDRNPKHLKEVLTKANAHKGTSFIEIYQNCIIFNDGAFDDLSNKETKEDNVLEMKHGEPLVFGKDNNKGIKLDGFTPKVVDLTTGEYSLDDLWVHDEFDESQNRAYILSQFHDNPNLPVPIGVFRQVNSPTLNEELEKQIKFQIEKKGKGNLESLLFSGNTWEVE
ncbi:MAG: 2-oxoacid:ferredoxin oxidoreductase subunit beta [Melioribacteraceae bacterium]|nr:2-oxoacid:ferredoxin oxidoreductase subunit beta [Melioribacteraceae bacterium]